MTGIGFTGSPAPGFDYRLYDETGKRVDFGISCYKRGDIFQVLKEMEDPRVLRNVLLETFDWDSHYLRSEVDGSDTCACGTVSGEKGYRWHMGGSEETIIRRIRSFRI